MTPSEMSDAELNHALAMASLNPMAYGSVAAIRAEKQRRLAAKSAPPREEPSQAANNDAAATEIAPDEEVAAPKPKVVVPTYRQRLLASPRGFSTTEADMLATESDPRIQDILEGAPNRSERFDAGMRRLDASLADALGHNAPSPMGTAYTRDGNGSAYAPLTDFGGGQTERMNGVDVPVVDLGDGVPRYRLGDEKRALEAAEDAAYADMVSKSAQDDLAAYGTRKLFQYKRGPDGKLTREVERVSTPGPHPNQKLGESAPSPLTAQEEKQQQNLANRKAMEGRQAEQNAMLRDRPGLKALEDREAASRATYNYMAGLAGGSSGLRGGHGGNMGMLRAIAMLRGVDPNNMTADQQALAQSLPIDPMRAQIEARRWDMAGRLAGDVVTGALAGQGRNSMAENAQGAQNLEAAQGYFDNWHAGNVGPIAGPYTRAKRDQMVNYLRLRFRLDLPTAEAIADSKPHVVAAGSPEAAPDSGGFGIPDGAAL